MSRLVDGATQDQKLLFQALPREEKHTHPGEHVMEMDRERQVKVSYDHGFSFSEQRMKDSCDPTPCRGRVNRGAGASQ